MDSNLKPIKMFGVTMATDVAKFVEPILQSGYVGEGQTVRNFEQAIGEFLGVEPERVVTVNSGTAAITMALRLAGVGSHSIVVSTPMTCLATNEPILSLGADVRWCDVEEDTGSMSPKRLRDSCTAIDDAVVCMHWGGMPCDMDELKKSAKGLPLIEDAAHAFGTTYKGRMIGNGTADFTCFSFQAIKHLTCVDGGALVCRLREDADRARLMRWYGLNRGAGDKMRCLQDPPEWGWKFHMNNVNAAIGLANIRFLPENLQRCREIAKQYDSVLKLFEHLRPVRKLEGCESAYWLYTLLADSRQAAARLIEFAQEQSLVELGRVHGRNDTKTIFAKSVRVLPGVDSFDDKHVCLPIGPWLSNHDVDRVCSVLVDFEIGERQKEGKKNV